MLSGQIAAGAESPLQSGSSQSRNGSRYALIAQDVSRDDGIDGERPAKARRAI